MNKLICVFVSDDGFCICELLGTEPAVVWSIVDYVTSGCGGRREDWWRIGGGGIGGGGGGGKKDWSIFLKGAKLVCCCCQGRGVYGKASQWIECVVFGEMDFQSRESVIDQTTH